MTRLMSPLCIVLSLALLVTGCSPQPAQPSPTPLRPTVTSASRVPAITATSVPVLPTATGTPLPELEDTPTPETTPAPSPTHTAEVSDAEHGSMIVMLMRAVNARERVVGRPQSNWGLEGMPDGGRDYPSLDALDNTTDLTPYVRVLQDAVLNLLGRPDTPDWRSMFWNDDTDTLYSSLAELNLYDGWRNSPEEGNLEEIRRVLEKMHTIVVFGKAITSLARFASRDTTAGYTANSPDERAAWDMDKLQNAMRLADPTTNIICNPKQCPPGKYASHYVGNTYPAAQLTRAFLSFDTSRLADGPAIVDPVRLRVKHVIVLSQINWDGDPNEEIRAGSIGVGVSSGSWDPNTNTGNGWGLGPAVWNSSAEESIRGWDSCPQEEKAASLAVATVGVKDGFDTCTLESDNVHTQGWTQFRIGLQDETNRANPGVGNVDWRLYGLSANSRDHWLIIPLALPPLPPMPAAFE